MRRSSIITIVLLVLVIVLLIVTLVFTNLPKKENVDDTPIENQEELSSNGEKEENEPEKPVFVDLNSDVVKKMYEILSSSYEFYKVKVGPVLPESLSNNAIQHIAFQISAQYKMTDTQEIKNGVQGKWTKADMDAAVKEVFGDISYTPGDFSGTFPEGRYNEQEQVYYHPVGFGGGGYFPYSIHGIFSVEEYSDRYEVKEKYIYVTPKEVVTPDLPRRDLGIIYTIKSWNSDLSETLGQYKEIHETGYYTDIQTIDEFISGVEDRNIYVGDPEKLGENKDKLLKTLSKFYDKATEYKHTFMKNSDGTYYWVKSEVIK